MSSAAQVLRQAESLKVTLVENGKSASETAVEDGRSVSDSSKGTSDMWVARQKLEDLYKRLLLMDLEYALDKKVEQDLWNHAFKNQITVLQTQAKDKHNPKKVEVQANLNLFLETASGFYLQFLQLICSTFKLDLPFRRKSSAFGVMKEKSQLRAKITPPKKSSCLYICQYCLVHLGDIARYRQQREQAQTYYRHAVNLSPQNGQPYNQLAILEVNRNNKLSSVFYYVRSLAVKHPFPVAATNLDKFYSKLIKDTSEFKGKMAQNEFVNAFLQFQALLHLAADFNRASYLCNRILACLPAHLVSQTFSASVLVQCVAITIFTLNHVRHIPCGGDTSSTSSPKGENGNGGCSAQLEMLMSAEEQKSLDIILSFTASVLELLIQHTPQVPSKARESPTLPAIQILLDWLIHSPDLITLPAFANSNIWGHLAKLLNVVQQCEEGKANHDLTKYDEVPLPEDTELRCFQPIHMAHSKYSFSRIPVDGFPRGVEELVRCMRLVNQGQTIAQEFPQLKLTAAQQSDSQEISFSGPLVMKSMEVAVSSQERRSKQNVAMQAIMKHGQGSQAEVAMGNSQDAGSLEQGCPKYLLGTVTSEPQFMKHGGTGNTSRLHTSPQLSPGFTRRGQSPQARGASPMQGLSSPRPALPPQQQQTSPSQTEPRPQQQQQVGGKPAPPLQQQMAVHNHHAGFQPSPTSPPSRGQSTAPQLPYNNNIPFQGQSQGQGHPGPGHSQVQGPQGHGFQGQAFHPMQGHRMETTSGQHGSTTQGGVPQYPAYQVPFPVMAGERFHLPGVQGMRQPFPAGPAPSSPNTPSLTQSAVPTCSARHPSPSHPLNQEMLSALRLASQITQQQVDANAHHPLQHQQDQQNAHGMVRAPIQRPPIMGHGPQGPVPRGGMGIGGTPNSSVTPGPFPGPGQPRPFHPGMGLPQHPPAAFTSSQPHHQPHPRLHSSVPARAHDMSLAQAPHFRPPAPPIPMPGQHSQNTQGFPSLLAGLFPQDGSGSQADGIRGYQALSPLTIQPPKSSPPDTRISSSFQGHAEGTPKPDKQEGLAPEKRELEPVIHRIGMPVGQTGGEYSLFASSSPWSMPLNSNSESKSMTSSPFSSQDSSMRNSPVIGFDPQAASPYDSAARHKGPHAEGWVSQGQGYEDQKGRGQGQQAGGMPSLWTEALTLTPLERLLEQQRMQRQTDPH